MINNLLDKFINLKIKIMNKNYNKFNKLIIKIYIINIKKIIYIKYIN